MLHVCPGEKCALFRARTWYFAEEDKIPDGGFLRGAPQPWPGSAGGKIVTWQSRRIQKLEEQGKTPVFNFIEVIAKLMETTNLRQAGRLRPKGRFTQQI
jgi:hypothetical protein